MFQGQSFLLPPSSIRLCSFTTVFTIFTFNDRLACPSLLLTKVRAPDGSMLDWLLWKPTLRGRVSYREYVGMHSPKHPWCRTKQRERLACRAAASGVSSPPVGSSGAEVALFGGVTNFGKEAGLATFFTWAGYFTPTLPPTPHLPGGCTFREKDTCDRGQCPRGTQLRPFSSMCSRQLGAGEQAPQHPLESQTFLFTWKYAMPEIMKQPFSLGWMDIRTMKSMNNGVCFQGNG